MTASAAWSAVDPLRVGRVGQRALDARVGHHHLEVLRQRGQVDRAGVWQSMRSAWPGHARGAGELVHDPARHAGGGLLGALAEQRPARRAGPSNPSASATATSSAADDDRPAPTGSVVVTVPTSPTPGAARPPPRRRTGPIPARRSAGRRTSSGTTASVSSHARPQHDDVAAALALDGRAEVDGHREHQPTGLVGVVAHEVDPSRGEGADVRHGRRTYGPGRD